MKKTLLTIVALFALATQAWPAGMAPDNTEDDEALAALVKDIDLTTLSWGSSIQVDTAYFFFDETNGVAAFERPATEVESDTYSIPSKVVYNGVTYPVIDMKNNYNTRSQPYINTLRLPATLRRISVDIMTNEFEYLRNLTIPATLDTICGDLPAYCTLHITFEGTTPPATSADYTQWGYYDITVPDGCMEAYTSGLQWKYRNDNSAFIHEKNFIVAEENEFTLLLPDSCSLSSEVESYLGEDAYNGIYSLTLWGPVGSKDFETLRKMPYLTKLDLSHAEFKALPAGALSGLHFLRKVIFPDGMTTIGASAFTGCTDLTSLPDGQYDTIGKYAFSEMHIDTIQFPSTVQYVGEYAFNQANVREVVLPDHITDLGSGAFRDAILIKKAEIPSTIKNIPEYAFEGCTRLQQLSLHEGLDTIWCSAFSGCEQLQELHLPSTTKLIDAYAFSGAKALSSLSLGDGLREIRSSSFYGCRSLTDVTIPDSVKTLGSMAFYNCTGLKSVSMGKGITDIDEYTFKGDTALTNVKFPEYLQRIEQQAFYDCKISKADLPSTVWYIGSHAFDAGQNLNYSHGQLETLVCRAVLPPEFVSDNVPNKLFVPSVGLSAYRSDDLWGRTLSILPLDIWPKNINVSNDLVLGAWPAPASYRPNVTLQDGSLTLLDGVTMDIDTLSFSMGQPILSRGNLKASHLSIKYEEEQERSREASWIFMTLPVTIAMKDVDVSGSECRWAVCSYSGANRAIRWKEEWLALTAQDTLYAGQAYALALQAPPLQGLQASSWATARLVASSDSPEMAFFTTDDADVSVYEYPSVIAYDGGWNFLGNPYQAYYNMGYADRTSPVIVYSDSPRRYIAYSMQDDEVILAPNSCFFVQYDGSDNIHFDKEGRQTDSSTRDVSFKVKSFMPIADGSRRICDIILSLDSLYSDRTRVVTSPLSSVQYEPACDAAKFFSMGGDMPQLYTLDSSNSLAVESASLAFAINERPTWTEPIPLGLYAPQEADYSLSIKLRGYDDDTFTLIDTWDDSRQTLTPDIPLTLHLEEGTSIGRYYIIPGEADATAIAQARTEHSRVSAAYLINGQRAPENFQGIVIKDGRKVKQ